MICLNRTCQGRDLEIKRLRSQVKRLEDRERHLKRETANAQQETAIARKEGERRLEQAEARHVETVRKLEEKIAALAFERYIERMEEVQ